MHCTTHTQPTTKARRDGEWLVLDCTDDGAGVRPDVRDRVFDPFFTTRRGAGGSGLGLHVVYNLVTGRLGGDIELLAPDGRGTTFRIRFPLRPVGGAEATERQEGVAG